MLRDAATMKSAGRAARATVLGLCVALVGTSASIAQTDEPPFLLTPIGLLTIAVIGETPTEIFHVAFEAANERGGVVGAGGGAGRPVVENIVLTRRPDGLSAELFRAVVTGLHLRSARIDVYMPQTETVLTSYQLSDVMVTRLTGIDGLEGVELAFGRIELTAADNRFCFDIATSASC